MDLWYVVALVLLIAAAVVAATQRAILFVLIAAGLACWVLPTTWAALH